MYTSNTLPEHPVVAAIERTGEPITDNYADDDEEEGENVCEHCGEVIPIGEMILETKFRNETDEYVCEKCFNNWIDTLGVDDFIELMNLAWEVVR